MPDSGQDNTAEWLAAYAVSDSDYGGRAHPEPGDPLRMPFELDRHRIVESTAFRRLENKTQVFAPTHHDHFRTRLTHTLEAAHVARTLARALGANDRLAEAITLAHDLGHPPFGHAGEAALDEVMAGEGGFNHNLHALRVVEFLEHPFPAFRGLNLTGATRAGMRAHATRYDVAEGIGATGASVRGPSVEARIASVADRIAYNCHDLEDAIGAGLIGSSDLSSVHLWRAAYDDVVRGTSVEHIYAVRRAVLDRMLDTVLSDVVEASRPLLGSIRSARDAGTSTSPLVTPSDPMDQHLGELERFLLERVYRHPEVASMDGTGRDMIRALFEAYRADPGKLPGRFSARIEEHGRSRVICDYIAGMTDRFCRAEHDRLTARS